VLLEAVDAVLQPVAVGHSTGGEYLLSVLGLEKRIAGLVLVSTAPDCGWMPPARRA
jgi:pimeloyl-ACP methyl ester carboxylesterase